MGLWLLTVLAEKDNAVCEEICKIHKIKDVKVVQKHYEQMLKNIEKELNEKDED